MKNKVNTYIDRDTLKWLTKTAKKNNYTLSDFTKILIDEYEKSEEYCNFNVPQLKRVAFYFDENHANLVKDNNKFYIKDVVMRYIANNS